MADDFFNDPFEDIVKQFFGESSKRKKRVEDFTEGEEEDRVIDFIETDSFSYAIFELPGYTEKDILVTTKGRILEVSAKKRSAEKVQDYLAQKFLTGLNIQKNLPGDIEVKTIKTSVKNGILEVSFKRK